jgi:hypothetical protein
MLKSLMVGKGIELDYQGGRGYFEHVHESGLNLKF